MKKKEEEIAGNTKLATKQYIVSFSLLQYKQIDIYMYFYLLLVSHRKLENTQRRVMNIRSNEKKQGLAFSHLC